MVLEAHGVDMQHKKEVKIKNGWLVGLLCNCTNADA